MAGPLSQSPLWAIQRRFFEEQGPEAWRRAIVPEYITSNPRVGRAMARLVHDWLKPFTLKRNAPLVVLELGAGSGRFAYHFVRHLLPIWSAYAPDIPLHYIMTDIAPANRQAWAQHPAFEPYRDHIDSAHLDIGRPPLNTTLLLDQQQRPLDLLNQPNPLVVVANYVFDSTLQDLVLVRNGVLHASHLRVGWPEGLPNTSSNPQDDRGEGPHHDSDPDSLSSPDLLGQLSLTFHHHATTPEALYPEQPQWQQLLNLYRRRLHQPSAVLLPTSALQTVDALFAHGRDGIVLFADRGTRTLHQLEGATEPQPLLHGSLSLPINGHALTWWMSTLGAQVHSLGDAHMVVGGCFGLPNPQAPALEAAFQDHLGAFTPEALLLLKNGLQRLKLDLLPNATLLFHLERSAWDPAFLDL
ncbi:MAG: hypothetical protein AAFX99_29285, partial [Myxococcota bacterium]